MNGVLLLGGEGPRNGAAAARAAETLNAADWVVAADSGFDLALALGTKPDLVVGDLDSVQSREAVDLLPRERVQRWPEDKDRTDAEIGVASLHDAGCTYITIIGGGGRRFDHQLAVLQLFIRDAMLKEWLTAYERIVVVDCHTTFAGWRGAVVSLFALTASVEGLASVGLRWPLSGLALSPSVASISNEVTADPFEIDLQGGRVLVVCTWPDIVGSAYRAMP